MTITTMRGHVNLLVLKCINNNSMLIAYPQGINFYQIPKLKDFIRSKCKYRGKYFTY